MIFFQILRHGTEAEIKVQLCGDPRGGLGGHEQLFVAERLQTVQRVRDERAGKSLALRVAAYGNPMQPATGQFSSKNAVAVATFLPFGSTMKNILSGRTSSCLP